MNRQQLYLIGAAFLLLLALYFFGPTKSETAKETDNRAALPPTATDTLTFDSMLSVSKKRISGKSLERVNALEQALAASQQISAKIEIYKQLSRFWMDSVGAFVPYVKYLGEAAKLENSEKTLTFAAHLMLAELPSVGEQGLQVWLAKEAKELFEKAKSLNPSNDSTLVGLGSCYFYGAGGSEPPMKGIMLIREVAERNPENSFAQYMLGIGATVSRQFDKAVERFGKVVELEPENIEARLRLADVTEQKGDKAEAKKQYEAFLRLVKKQQAAGKFKASPEMIRDIEAHIETLK